MKKKLFDYNPDFGITRWAYLDDENDQLHIETVQDATPIIEANKRALAATGRRDRYNDGMHHAARLPMAVYEDLIQRKILVIGKNGDGEGNKRFKQWLNHPDNRFFRVREGKV